MSSGGSWWRRRGASSAAVGLTSLSLLAATGWALLGGTATPGTRFDLTSGAAWLLSPDKGYVTLIDGPSEQVVATVLAPSSGNGLSITQDGASAYIADDRTATVTRIDGATYRTSTPITFAAPDSDLSVLAGADPRTWSTPPHGWRRWSSRIDSRSSDG